MMPEQDYCPLWNLPAAIDDQLKDCVEMGFACWNMPGIDVIRFESGKE
jgi:hypothetical protein